MNEFNLCEVGKRRFTAAVAGRRRVRHGQIVNKGMKGNGKD